jgi:uncharacterized protein (DUF1778 family)
MAHQDQAYSSETRISMRIDPARKEVISRAARIRHTTLSAFMIENAYSAATELLADQTQIVMSEKEIDHFFNVLDKPPQKNINALVKLLSTKSVLDE